MFMFARIALNMCWHKDKKRQYENNGIIRHPFNSLAQKKFDELHCSFAEDVRNVRFCLAIDIF